MLHTEYNAVRAKVADILTTNASMPTLIEGWTIPHGYIELVELNANRTSQLIINLSIELKSGRITSDGNALSEKEFSTIQNDISHLNESFEALIVNLVFE